MGYRLSKIYTRTGDDGTTGLGDGSRIDKTDIRVAAMGDIDELNSAIGLIVSHLDHATVSKMLVRIQHELFDVGAELCIPGATRIASDQVEQLEQDLDHLNDQLAPLKEFILPGGATGTAFTHMARAICRRAERSIVQCNKQATVNPQTLQYVNRLSDLLFVIARTLGQQAQKEEIAWESMDSD